MKTRVVCVVALVAAVAAATNAQQPAFKSGVDLVRIPVSVSQGSTPVPPGVLTAVDFIVTEDGVRQLVTLFERESSPLSICVVLDLSHSMADKDKSALAMSALRQVVTRLLPEDEVAVITFAQKPVVTLPWTAAPNAARLSIDLKVDGMTALNDAVTLALETIDGARNPRRAILVVSDGFENASRRPLAEVVRTRRQSETQIYAFRIAPWVNDARTRAPGYGSGTAFGDAVPVPPPPPADVVNILPLMVEGSGGTVYQVRLNVDPAPVARAFVDDLRLQFTLGYSPVKPLDGKYRRVKVEMKKRGFKVRHRGGYLALPMHP